MPVQQVWTDQKYILDNFPKKIVCKVLFVNEKIVTYEYTDHWIKDSVGKCASDSAEFFMKNFSDYKEKPRYFMNIYKSSYKEKGVFGGAIHKSLEQAMGFRSNHYLKTIEITDLINEE